MPHLQTRKRRPSNLKLQFTPSAADAQRLVIRILPLSLLIGVSPLHRFIPALANPDTALGATTAPSSAGVPAADEKLARGLLFTPPEEFIETRGRR
ncbi:MAG: hypothetical protein ACP5R4_11805 [Armatimonadota bacterium]